MKAKYCARCGRFLGPKVLSVEVRRTRLHYHAKCYNDLIREEQAAQRDQVWAKSAPQKPED